MVRDSKNQWNDYLSRIEIKETPRTNKYDFTNLWHALQGRRIISDVNGKYSDMTGDKQRIGQIPWIKTVSPNSTTIIPTLFGVQWTLIPLASGISSDQ